MVDVFGKDLFSNLIQPQHHPSPCQSYPCKRSDTCCYPSRRSYGIWLSDVPRGLWCRRPTTSIFRL